MITYTCFSSVKTNLPHGCYIFYNATFVQKWRVSKQILLCLRKHSQAIATRFDWPSCLPAFRVFKSLVLCVIIETFSKDCDQSGTMFPTRAGLHIEHRPILRPQVRRRGRRERGRHREGPGPITRWGWGLGTAEPGHCPSNSRLASASGQLTSQPNSANQQATLPLPLAS